MIIATLCLFADFDDPLSFKHQDQILIVATVKSQRVFPQCIVVVISLIPHLVWQNVTVIANRFLFKNMAGLRNLYLGVWEQLQPPVEFAATDGATLARLVTVNLSALPSFEDRQYHLGVLPQLQALILATLARGTLTLA